MAMTIPAECDQFHENRLVTPVWVDSLFEFKPPKQLSYTHKPNKVQRIKKYLMDLSNSYGPVLIIPTQKMLRKHFDCTRAELVQALEELHGWGYRYCVKGSNKPVWLVRRPTELEKKLELENEPMDIYVGEWIETYWQQSSFILPEAWDRVSRELEEWRKWLDKAFNRRLAIPTLPAFDFSFNPMRLPRIPNPEWQETSPAR